MRNVRDCRSIHHSTVSLYLDFCIAKIVSAERSASLPFSALKGVIRVDA